MPYFSIVVPTYNRIDMLGRVLAALGHQQDAPDFEVVVIDDGSTDDTVERMDRNLAEARSAFPIRFASQANSGPGRARNHGVTLARGRYVIFIGDDTVPESRFLAERARVHRESGDDGLVACLGYTGWPPAERVTAFMDYINDYGLQFGYKLIEHNAVVPFNFFYTSNISLSRQLLAHNPFDTTFAAAAWEDIELAFRLDAIGLKIRYNALAVARHYHPTTVDSFSRRQYMVGKSGAILYEKHPELADLLRVTELVAQGTASDMELRHLRLLAIAGERFRQFARTDVFERLMRQHYLRGLRDGLSASSSRAE
ncbi:MAG: glycosyltransferase family 2 protein [Pseudomonadota bacterium]|nr:glycosyltransferase family 2 protein [Pseudomonadota bacterium]